jgi:hypothetical protein
MRNAENTADIRLLTDAELEHVSGAVLAAFIGGAIGYLSYAVPIYWDLPFGTTKQQAAAALGVEHLF